MTIARALASKAPLILCDEPVASLDVSLQEEVLQLLADLREEHDLTYIFISHDLGSVARIADRVAVMYLGRIVEIGPVATVLRTPSHPYTQALLAAAPHIELERAVVGKHWCGASYPTHGIHPRVVDSHPLPVCDGSLCVGSAVTSRGLEFRTQLRLPSIVPGHIDRNLQPAAVNACRVSLPLPRRPKRKSTI